MTKPTAVLQRGVVYVRDGSIAAVQDAAAPVPDGFDGVKVFDTGGSIYPGLIDLHNHLSYNALQLWDVPNSYANRDQWARGDTYRKLVTGPMAVLAQTPRYVPAIVRYVEAKCLVAGTTTAQGLALASDAGIRRFYRGIVRNVEQTNEPRLPEAATHIADVEAKDREKFLARLKAETCLLLHLSEGTDDAAHQHFEALRSPSGRWSVWDSLAAIHCVALGEQDFEVLAKAGASMVWSPLSNLLLYGETAKIRPAVRSGLTIALGPDWSPSGSKNLLGELKIARVAADEAKADISDFDLLCFATRDAAKILHWDAELGTLEDGRRADLLVVSGTDADAHSHLLTRTEHDVELVVINGFPRYGATAPMRHLLDDAADTETATIAGRARVLNLHQATADPGVGKLTLKEATELLADGLKRLPELAKDLARRPSAGADGAAGEPGVFLVLDQDDVADADLRPHLPDARGNFTAEPSPDALKAPSTPLADLLVPLQLDALTVSDDERFVPLLAKERNLPAAIASQVGKLYS